MEKEQYLKIGRPQNVCVKCGVQINEAGKHPSVIMGVPAGELPADEETDDPVRQDFCRACWEEMRDGNYFSYWLARREKPKPKKIQTRKERNSMLLSYFDFLYAKGDPDYAQNLYFLAHLLMKFSVFKWVRTEPPVQESAGERVVFRNTVTDDFMTVEAVPLDDERLVSIKREIDEFISRAAEGTQEPPKKD